MKARALWLPLALVVASTTYGDIFRPSFRQQVQLGQQGAAQVREKEKVLPDTDPRVQEVRRITQTLVAQLPEAELRRTGFNYSIDVIDSKEVNAFVFPGGPMFIYVGLLDELTTEDQIAGIIAHEIIHARNQHWASAYSDNMKRRLGILAVLTLLDAGELAFDVAGVADTFLFTLPYSRRHETEADVQGVDLMIKAGYNPQGMVEVFRVLMQKANGRNRLEWASTHPDNSRRIREVERRITAMNRTFPPQRTRQNLPRREQTAEPVRPPS